MRQSQYLGWPHYYFGNVHNKKIDGISWDEIFTIGIKNMGQKEGA
jgi:hypothetical protein